MNLNDDRFSTVTQNLLSKAGWYPGRNIFRAVQLAKGFEIFPAAVTILSEFGNLKVGEQRPGIERIQSIITFEPKLVDYENDRFSEWAKEIHSNLYPLGELTNDLYFLVVSENGGIYLIETRLIFVAETIDLALEKLLRGLKF